MVMPAPRELQLGSGRLPVTTAWSVAVRGHDDAQVRAGFARALRRAEERTGLTFSRLPTGEFSLEGEASRAGFVIECAGPSQTVPTLGEDESYTLEVTAVQVVLRAPTGLGILRGFETLLQLLQADASGWFLPTVSIRDEPRFPWRGLLIDVARHWQPLDVILRNLDGMALVKLNVLHLHLTEDQGIRIESRKYPRLHELGSDGHYFTQEQIRKIVAYAAERGIRVVPEFDVPGHATSWVTAYPELASAPGPYSIERQWTVFDPVLDPTNPAVYAMLDGFLGEMAALFPDAYVHIGGDEVTGVHWSGNQKIQTFIGENDLKDNAGLQSYFNRRVHAILARHGKRLIGWDEILHSDLPAGIVVQSWRGPEGLADSTKRGFTSLLSHGFYINFNEPAGMHYLNDPVPAGTALTLEQQSLVLGGEATMWSEWVSSETIDSRIWPRTAAIAERLWSAQTVCDVSDMYHRLSFVSRRLEEAGLQHESYRDPAIRRLAGDTAAPADLEALRTLVDLLEPVSSRRRTVLQLGYSQFTPLTDLADCARPDSKLARDFANGVAVLVRARDDCATRTEAFSRQLAGWRQAATRLEQGLCVHAPRLQAAAPLAAALVALCDIGQTALQALADKRAPQPGWLQTQFTKLDVAAQSVAATILPMVAPLRLLAVAAAEQDRRTQLSDDDWEQHLLTHGA